MWLQLPLVKGVAFYTEAIGRLVNNMNTNTVLGHEIDIVRSKQCTAGVSFTSV